MPEFPVAEFRAEILAQRGIMLNPVGFVRDPEGRRRFEAWLDTIPLIDVPAELVASATDAALLLPEHARTQDPTFDLRHAIATRLCDALDCAWQPEGLEDHICPMRLAAIGQRIFTISEKQVRLVAKHLGMVS